MKRPDREPDFIVGTKAGNICHEFWFNEMIQFNPVINWWFKIRINNNIVEHSCLDENNWLEYSNHDEILEEYQKWFISKLLE